MRASVVVLAAGEASRFGSPKQEVLLPRVLERLRETSIDEIVVVTGAHPLEIRSDTAQPGVRLVQCHEWARGPGASLRCGLEALDQDTEAAVVVLADGPKLAPQAVERVLGVWQRDGGLVAASYAGERGHPLVVGREDWQRVPDTGLRDLQVTLVPCDDLGSPGDVDTEEDLRTL
jgi:CTP:molybdopterin cytidylyltransferase MocA